MVFPPVSLWVFIGVTQPAFTPFRRHINPARFFCRAVPETLKIDRNLRVTSSFEGSCIVGLHKLQQLFLHGDPNNVDCTLNVQFRFYAANIIIYGTDGYFQLGSYLCTGVTGV